MNIEKEMICVVWVGVGGERGDGFTDLFEKINRQLDLGFLLVLSIKHQFVKARY